MRPRRGIYFRCWYCDSWNYTSISKFKIKNRHFCNHLCYSNYRKEFLPKEEQNSYKNGGFPIEEKKKRIKARSDLNHAIRDGKINRGNCIKCGKLAEAHHEDYYKPLEVTWLCTKHHWKIYENPELLKD